MSAAPTKAEDFWPFARCKNFVKHLVTSNYIARPPQKRLTHASLLQLLASYARITVPELLQTNPIVYGTKYLQRSEYFMISMLGKSAYWELATTLPTA